jgi:predicted SnoaL-like aldol condensation-catalyzing enzyme
MDPRTPRQLFDDFVASAQAGPQPMAPSIEANKALVLRYFEMWNTGDGSVADAVLGGTYLDHAHPEVLGPAAARSLVPRFHAANPAARMTVEIAAADGEFVAVRNTIVRTIDGAPVESNGIALFRIAGGKLAEQWSWYPHAEAAALGARSSIDAWLSFRA